MKLTKASLLKKQQIIEGFGEDQESVYAEFQYWSVRDKVVFPKQYKILYADYTYEDYSGDAYVLGFDKEQNKFFEVHGSHCSCYALEGQWDPEYFANLEQLQSLCEKRFESRADSYYSRYANSSVEFEGWLTGDVA